MAGFVDIGQANTAFVTAVSSGDAHGVVNALGSGAEVGYLDWQVLVIAARQKNPEVLARCLERLSEQQAKGPLDDEAEKKLDLQILNMWNAAVQTGGIDQLELLHRYGLINEQVGKNFLGEMPLEGEWRTQALKKATEAIKPKEEPLVRLEVSTLNNLSLYERMVEQLNNLKENELDSNQIEQRIVDYVRISLEEIKARGNLAELEKDDFEEEHDLDYKDPIDPVLQYDPHKDDVHVDYRSIAENIIKGMEFFEVFGNGEFAEAYKRIALLQLADNYYAQSREEACLVICLPDSLVNKGVISRLTDEAKTLTFEPAAADWLMGKSNKVLEKLITLESIDENFVISIYKAGGFELGEQLEKKLFNYCRTFSIEGQVEIFSEILKKGDLSKAFDFYNRSQLRNEKERLIEREDFLNAVGYVSAELLKPGNDYRSAADKLGEFLAVKSEEVDISVRLWPRHKMALAIARHHRETWSRESEKNKTARKAKDSFSNDELMAMAVVSLIDEDNWTMSMINELSPSPRARWNLFRAALYSNNLAAAGCLIARKGRFEISKEDTEIGPKTSEGKNSTGEVFYELIAPFLQKDKKDQEQELDGLLERSGINIDEAALKRAKNNYNFCSTSEDSPVSPLCKIAVKVAYGITRFIPHTIGSGGKQQVNAEISTSDLKDRFEAMLVEEVSQLIANPNKISSHPNELSSQTIDHDQAVDFVSGFVRTVMVPKLLFGDSHPLDWEPKDRQSLINRIEEFKAGAIDEQQLTNTFYPEALQLLNKAMTFANMRELIKLGATEPAFALPAEYIPLRSIGDWEIPFNWVEINGINFRCIPDADKLKKHGYNMNHCVGGSASTMLGGGNCIVAVSIEGTDLATYHLAEDDEDTFKVIERKGIANQAVPDEIEKAWTTLESRIKNGKGDNIEFGTMKGETKESKESKAKLGGPIDHYVGFRLDVEGSLANAASIFSYYQGKVLQAVNAGGELAEGHKALQLQRKDGLIVTWI